MKAKGNYKVHVRGEWKYFDTLAAATEFCNEFHAQTDIVLSIEHHVTRIKRINSHVGISRYMNTLADTGHVIARIASIPSPYAYSPTHSVYRNDGGHLVFIVETAHKQYDVFLVPCGASLFVELENGTRQLAIEGFY